MPEARPVTRWSSLRRSTSTLAAALLSWAPAFGPFSILAGTASAASPPVLRFSDLINGPRTGLGDGLGQGAIVTVWGNNLGSARGTSRVYVGTPGASFAEAAYYYYWKNADGALPGGPAPLYESHKMQEVAFSIPSTAPTGSQQIWVEVGGAVSNTRPFNVTASGKIFFVSPGGNDSNAGTWVSPWETLTCSMGSGCTVSPAPTAGDIVYYVGVSATLGNHEGDCRDRDGSANNLVGFVAYPNTSVSLTGGLGGSNWSNQCSYVVISKFLVRDDVNPFSSMPYSRLIGNAATQVTCADGSAGAFYGWQRELEGARLLGNYVHDFGCDTTSNQEHATYFTGRDLSGTGPFVLAAPFELGWFYLKDNRARQGIHIYDEHGCFSVHGGPVLVHDNVVVNQVQSCFEVNVGGCSPGYSMDSQTEIDFYDNVCINTGRSGGTSAATQAVWIGAGDNHGLMKVYNNTIDGYSESGCTDASCVALNVGSWMSDGAFPGTLEWKNNIVVDTQGQPFYNGYHGEAPAAAGGNLWYSSRGNRAAPTWDTGPMVNTNPLLADAGANDVSLQSGSPAIDKGVDTSPVVVRDIAGTSRPQGSGYDIGAYEYLAPCNAATDCKTPPPCHSATGATCNGGCFYPDSADGAACLDDSDPCTDDVCQAGACVHPPKAGTCADAGTSGPDASAPKPDASAPGLDAGSTCFAGAACTSLDGCKTGTIDCGTGRAVCLQLQNRANGAACSGGVCNGGVCDACSAGQSCTSIDGCKAGTISCSSGQAVCSRLANQNDGTPCAGGTCSGGLCHPNANADAGPAGGPFGTGCGCAASASGSAWAPLAVAALIAVRRRRQGQAGGLSPESGRAPGVPRGREN